MEREKKTAKNGEAINGDINTGRRVYNSNIMKRKGKKLQKRKCG